MVPKTLRKLEMKVVGKPDAGNLHVRFDEGPRRNSFGGESGSTLRAMEGDLQFQSKQLLPSNKVLSKKNIKKGGVEDSLCLPGGAIAEPEKQTKKARLKRGGRLSPYYDNLYRLTGIDYDHDPAAAAFDQQYGYDVMGLMDEAIFTHQPHDIWYPRPCESLR